LLYDAAKAALDDSGLTVNDLDSCVVGSASEFMNLQPIPVPMIAEALGMVRKPVIYECNAGGSVPCAMLIAYWQIQSGFADTVLVIAGDKPSDADISDRPGFQNIITFCIDKFFEVPLGFIAMSIFALPIRAYVERYGLTPEQAAKVSIKNHKNAKLNPNAQGPMDLTVDQVLKSQMIADPIKFLDCCLVTDGYGAIILSSEEKAKKSRKPPIWLDGIAYVNDMNMLGYREVMTPGTSLCDMIACRTAAEKAYKMAGIKHPRREIDVAEVQDAYSWLELMTYDFMGFCGRGEGGLLIDQGVTELGGDLPVNPSGGCMGHGHAIGGVGIFANIEIIRQLRGECGAYQVDPLPKTGVAETMGGGGLNLSGTLVWRR
jgi:acetyl-CoA C-acetyltransferase